MSERIMREPGQAKPRTVHYVCPLFEDNRDASPCRFSVLVEGINMEPLDDGRKFVPTDCTLIKAVYKQDCPAGLFLENLLASNVTVGREVDEDEDSVLGPVSQLLKESELCIPSVARRRRMKV